MPKPRTAPTLIDTMSKETFELLTEKRAFALVPFKSTFAQVAHKHDIWHHEGKGQYNYFFRQVMQGVKRLIRKSDQSIEMKQKQIPLESLEKIAVPEILPKRSKYDLTLELF